VQVLLISTYDMGRQPFGLASPAAWLLEAGIDVTCVDLAKEELPEPLVRDAEAVGFFLPMHTATRLALPVIDRVRATNPSARLIAYGLYAPLNAHLLRARGVTERDVPRARRDLRANVGHDDVDGDDAEASVVDGDDGAMTATVLAPAAGLCVADGPPLVTHLQHGVPGQRQ